MGAWYLWGRSGEPVLFPQERGGPDPPRGPAAGGVPPQSARAQPGKAERAAACNRRRRQSAHAAHRASRVLPLAHAITLTIWRIHPLASPDHTHYKAHEAWRASSGALGVSIMAVPKRKISRMKRGNRRSHDALSSPAYVE